MNRLVSSKVMLNAARKIRCSIYMPKKTFSMAADIEQKKNTIYQNSKEKLVIISGFSRFASRTDLELCLGDIKPLIVDPLLDVNLYPTGKWALQLSPADFHQLRTRIKNREMRDLKLLSIDNANNPELDRTARKFQISNRTVRFTRVHKDCGPNEINFFLQDFDLEKSNNAIILISKDHATSAKIFSHYLVNFATPEEAERAVFEKCFATFEGYPVQMFWYHC